MRLNLYEHNRIAYEKAIKLLNETGKAAVIHPTGTGKSFIAFHLVEENPQSTFLWLAPSEYIFRMQKKKIKDSQGIVFKNIVFRTYPWIFHNMNNLDTLNPDYIILDEFHRAGAREWGKNVKKIIELNPNAKILGLSATNIRYLDNQRDMAKELFDGNIASEITLTGAMGSGMLPVPKYVISVYSYKSRIKVYEQRVKNIKNRKRREESERLLERLRRALDMAEGLDTVFNRHTTEKTGKYIVFCAGLNHMYEMIAQAPQWFKDIDARPHIYCVHSLYPDSDRDFQGFIEDDSLHLKLLFTINILNEGIHINGIDGAILLRPTTSPIIYKQQIGRALSSDPSSKPVIFDLVNNFDSLSCVGALKEELEQNWTLFSKERRTDKGCRGFEIVDELIDCRALFEGIQKNLDTSWDDYYAEYLKYVEKYNDARPPRKYITDNGLWLGRWLMRQREIHAEGKLEKSRIDQLEAAGISWESESDENFSRWVHLLREYKNRYGHCRVPSKYTSGGKALGNWCHSVRKQYRNGRLPEERIEILNQIGFSWERNDIRWKDGYEHAKKYYKKYGNLDVKRSYVASDGYKLGLWIGTQRKVAKGKTYGNLTESKIAKLNSLGMIWESDGIFTEFDDRIAAYKTYVNIYSEPVMSRLKAGKVQKGLYEWVLQVRKQGREGKLPEEYARKLDEIKFVWDPEEYRWNRMFDVARDYFKQYGSLMMSDKYVKTHGTSLVTWVANQKREYNKESHGRLSEDKIIALESIGMYWDTRSEHSWNRGYSAFSKYVKHTGSTIIRTDYVTEDGFDLGRWVTHKKAEYNSGLLSKERIRLFNKLGMIWESNISRKSEQYWNDMYKVAKRYYKRHGNLNIKTDYVTKNGDKLGQWIASQRTLRRKAERQLAVMDAERINKLDQIGIIWNPTTKNGQKS